MHKRRVDQLVCSAAIWLVAARALAHAPDVQRALPQPSEYLVLGIEHILSGIDHLLFLAALLLGTRTVHAALPIVFRESHPEPLEDRPTLPEAPRARARARRSWPKVRLSPQLRDVLYTVSAFTIAHSITLALAVLGVVHPNAVAVEVMIALSIAYVAFENLIGRGGNARFGVTLGFGLVHGLGFASALAEIGISQTRLLPSLLMFNLGVETGQLGVIAVLYPAVRFLQRGGARRRVALRGLSAALVAVGLIWAGERVVLGEAVQPPAAEALASPALARAPQAGAVLPHSVYPTRGATLAPGVEKLCTALAELPRVRRAECSGRKPGVTLASECERMLDAALRDGAIAFSSATAEQCIADQTQRYATCEFTKATTLAPLPSCSALLAGRRSAGATCRSSLECGQGLHCSGASPLQTGVCALPAVDGARCGLATDALAAYVPSRDGDHPECAGNCVQDRCQSATASAP
jgi:HupE/UreJ protein